MRKETSAVLFLVFALTGVGALMVYSASALNPIAMGAVNRHFISIGIGVVAMTIASRFDYRHLKDPLIFRLLFLFAVGGLIAVLIPGVGTVVDGGRRWIRFLGFSYQPSEFAKFALILILAAKLTDNREQVEKFWKGFVPPVLLTCMFAGLVLLERDLGVPFLMVCTAGFLFFAAGTRLRYLIGSGMLAMGAVVALIYAAPHRLRRVMAFTDPWEYRDDAGWHLVQSFAAFAQGGIWGRGAGASEQKLGYLPAAHTDFIFSVIGEELGLVGSLTVVAMFVALALVGFRIAMHARDHFGSLLALGITALISFQAIFIIGVTLGLVPPKGLPLPFISYGGTAIIVFLGMSGVLVNVGVQAIEPSSNRKMVPSAAGSQTA
jgi:cell division protein FtsW